MTGEVTLRCLGNLEDLEILIEILKKVFGENIWCSQLFLNRRDPGYRFYANLRVQKRKEGKVEDER